jgi:hypothetical protein
MQGIKKLPPGRFALQYVSIGCRQEEHDTEKAVLFIIDGSEVWIPKACLAYSLQPTGQTTIDKYGRERRFVRVEYHVLRSVAIEKRIRFS